LDTIRYALGVLLVITLPPAIVWWFVIHPFVGFWRRVGARTAFRTNLILMLASIAALWLVRRPLVGADLGTHAPLFVLGAALLALSFAMGLRRRRHLPMRVLAGLPELEEDGKGGRLLTEGPYARIRHPRYVEVAVGVMGYAALANHLGAWTMAFASLPVLHLVVVVEERELAQRFGAEFEVYRSTVPRYVPRRGAG
jgi:protein-S-isoprenylcysteine O-methyltransferase Ste14